MPLPSLRPVLARFRNIFAAMLLGIVLIACLLMVSSREPVAAPVAPSPDTIESSPDQPSRTSDSAVATVPRIAFSTEELLGTADPATAGSLVFDLQGDGKPALLVWSSKGIQLYTSGFSPVAAEPLASFKDVRDVTAADFNNDGTQDLCVIAAGRVSILTNRKGSLEPPGSGYNFKGQFVRALWLDLDHDGDLDLILLGVRPLALRNQNAAGFVPIHRAIPFVSGSALAGVVLRRISEPKAADFVVSYRNRAGVLYQDRLDGTFEAKNLPALPAEARLLRAGDFTGDGAEDLAFLSGRNATLLENLGSSWKIRKSVPTDGGYLFADFANLAVQDWLAGGVLLAGDDAGFSQSRDMAVATAATALVAADFDLDGKLDLAGVAKDGSILRCLNQTATENHWMRIGLRDVAGARTVEGTVVTVKMGDRMQQFLYGATPLHVGMRSFLTADSVQLTWPDGIVQTEPNLETNKAYVLKKASPTGSSGISAAPPVSSPTASR